MKLFTNLKNHLRDNWTSTGTILFLVVGLALGNAIRLLVFDGRPLDKITASYLFIVPNIFIRCLMLVVVPFLVASLSTSLLVEEAVEVGEHVKTSHVKSAKQLISLTMAFFLSFLVICTILGISLALIFAPGKSSTIQVEATLEPNSTSLIADVQKRAQASTRRLDSIMNILLNLFPSNIVSTLFQTTASQTTPVWPQNQSKLLEPEYQVDVTSKLTYRASPNLLGICLSSLLLGAVLQALGPQKTATIRSLLFEVNDISNYLFNGLMQTMPVVMFIWMLQEGLKMTVMEGIVTKLAFFLLLAAFGFLCLFLGFYPLVYYLFIRKNPYVFYRNLFEPMMVALGSSSSLMTLPFTMKAMTDRVGLDPRIAKFVLPLGVTIHMNGTAFYYTMMVLFVSQIKGHDLDFTSVVVIGVMVILVTMSLPGTTGGTSGVILILEATGLRDSMAVIAIILAIDFVVERVRTMTNITCDCFAAICIESVIEAADKRRGSDKKIDGTAATQDGEIAMDMIVAEVDVVKAN